MNAADRAADILLRGGVIAYPTESVFGLGCLPDNPRAVQHLLAIKQRSPRKGLILIAANSTQLRGWIDLPNDISIPAPDTDKAITWVVPAGPLVEPLVRGENTGIAVRVTTHPVAAAICEAADSPITSTSANLSGKPVARNRFVLQRQFGTLVDYVVPGDCGPARGPSEIRNLLSGDLLRANCNE